MSESPKHAQQRQAKALIEIIGTALAVDGNRRVDPGPTAEARVINQALQMAAITAADITYINTHGSASPLGDEVEIAALNSVFKHHIGDI